MRQMRAFYRLSLLGSARGQPAEIASRVLREFAGTMGFRRAEIWLLDRLKRLRRLSGYGRVPLGPTRWNAMSEPRSCATRNATRRSEMRPRSGTKMVEFVTASSGNRSGVSVEL